MAVRVKGLPSDVGTRSIHIMYSSLTSFVDYGFSGVSMVFRCLCHQTQRRSHQIQHDGFLLIWEPWAGGVISRVQLD